MTGVNFSTLAPANREARPALISSISARCPDKLAQRLTQQSAAMRIGYVHQAAPSSVRPEAHPVRLDLTEINAQKAVLVYVR
ncbi:hypothetical protein C770_GR4pC1147 (plasmid) [Sinorhizobium meliloti GR4]|nr:hypothetical protein C770_GR4pC1147 [Sinorhizobium meliloti GR4]